MWVFYFALSLSILGADADAAPPTVLVVQGAAGGPEYGEKFVEWSERWRDAAEKASARFTLIGQGEAEGLADRDRLAAELGKLSGEGSAPLWIVLIGHGTFDGRSAKFNLRGPDVTASELSQWLAEVERPTALINCTSSSGPFINHLSGKNRVVITATRSGNEQSFAHFGEFISRAINETAADLDKDGQVSLLEAYLTACRRVEEFYNEDARLVTEHALLDDNGDSLGTPASWFRGLRATQRAKDGASLDGTRAHQFHLIESDRERKMPQELRERRDQLELQIEDLRLERGRLGDDEYYDRLETRLIDLARAYQSADLDGVSPSAQLPK
jgi:hypothetical protein